MASFGKDLGLSTWGAGIVHMHSIHPRLFLGSRLSAQAIIDNGQLYDQNKKYYKANAFYSVCVAAGSTCNYCEISSKYKRYDITDSNHEDDAFLETVMMTADHIHSKLRRGKKVIVHCHSGRNRAALAVLVYCARHKDPKVWTYEKSLYEIRLLNSSRFSMQSTLQNNSFTSAVRRNWDTLRSASVSNNSSCTIF